jgi:hypothetical protein
MPIPLLREWKNVAFEAVGSGQVKRFIRMALERAVQARKVTGYSNPTLTRAGSSSAARRSFSCASSTSRWRFHKAA